MRFGEKVSWRWHWQGWVIWRARHSSTEGVHCRWQSNVLKIREDELRRFESHHRTAVIMRQSRVHCDSFWEFKGYTVIEDRPSSLVLVQYQNISKIWSRAWWRKEIRLTLSASTREQWEAWHFSKVPMGKWHSLWRDNICRGDVVMKGSPTTMSVWWVDSICGYWIDVDMRTVLWWCPKQSELSHEECVKRIYCTEKNKSSNGCLHGRVMMIEDNIRTEYIQNHFSLLLNSNPHVHNESDRGLHLVTNSGQSKMFSLGWLISSLASIHLCFTRNFQSIHGDHRCFVRTNLSSALGEDLLYLWGNEDQADRWD